MIFKNNKLIQYLFHKILSESSCLGNVIFYLFFICLQFVIGEKLLSFKLVIALIVSYLIIVPIRLLYYKDRPIQQQYNNWFEKIESSSFPSMHATRIIFIALFFINYYKNIFVTILFVILTLIIGSSRIYLKKHFLSDVIVGYFIGIIIFIGVEILFKF